MRQELAPIRRNRRLYSCPRGGIDEQNHAAAASGAANFAGQRALPSRGGDEQHQAIDLHLPCGQDRDQSALAVPDHDDVTWGEIPCK